MGMMKKINASDAKLNMLFSAPVYFEDGKNMFLAEGRTVKPYHLAAIKRWNIKYLLTSGQAIEPSEGVNIERMAGFDKQKLAAAKNASSSEAASDIEELEEL